MAAVMTAPEQRPRESAPATPDRHMASHETSIDASVWLHDIRREFPLIGVIHDPGASRWTAVWGKTWQLSARTAFELYDQLRTGGLPYRRKDQT